MVGKEAFASRKSAAYKWMLEKTCYIFLSAASLVAIVVLIHREFGLPRLPQAVSQAETEQLLLRTHVSLPGIQVSSRNVILAISTHCHFCDESMPFYHNLSVARTDTKYPFKLIVIAPEGDATIRQHLTENNVQVDGIKSESLDHIKVTGTPTLFISDKQGTVKSVFIGKLTSANQRTVFERLHDRS